MGKFDIISKVAGKATVLWKGFIKKSPVYIVLSSLTVVSVLGLGVGGTLAATGVIPNPFASSTPDESSPEELEGSSDQGRIPIGDGTLPSDVGEWGAIAGLCEASVEVQCELARRGSELIESGWTGTIYNFSKDGYYSYSMVNVAYPDDLKTRVEINGRLFSSGSILDCKPIAPERWKQDWNGHCSTMTNAPFFNKEWLRGQFALCQPGGDTYIVEASGGGYSFRESGIIPPEYFDCPPAESSPSPTPEASPTPEQSPTPESSSEPESSPTPTP
jgi:hypothetical protein